MFLFLCLSVVIVTSQLFSSARDKLWTWEQSTYLLSTMSFPPQPPSHSCVSSYRLTNSTASCPVESLGFDVCDIVCLSVSAHPLK